MTRVKRSYVAKKRRNRIFNLMKGSKRAHSRLARTAQQQVLKKLSYSHRDRGLRKRNFRSLWITRINAAAKKNKLNYNKLIAKLRTSKILLNRKILAQMAVLDSASFNALIGVIT